MAKVKELTLRFKQSVAPDVVVNRIRIRPANTEAVYDTPFDDVTPPTPDADGYTRIPFANIPSAAGLEGTYDLHVTSVDGKGNESDFLEVDNQTFDISPPDAPPDGAVE
jgi:hypothetical protein